ncbi:hypothetical protein [Xanthomonas vasicola]|uniref:hypothetical protein n=1 Tax=Xanthomonas vasicola TaxID=56459 RepID=UPI001D0C61C9|nr:hypothetical protein [Xanthomonas vasicola]
MPVVLLASTALFLAHAFRVFSSNPDFVGYEKQTVFYRDLAHALNQFVFQLLARVRVRGFARDD